MLVTWASPGVSAAPKKSTKRPLFVLSSVGGTARWGQCFSNSANRPSLPHSRMLSSPGSLSWEGEGRREGWVLVEVGGGAEAEVLGELGDDDVEVEVEAAEPAEEVEVRVEVAAQEASNISTLDWAVKGKHGGGCPRMECPSLPIQYLWGAGAEAGRWPPGRWATTRLSLDSWPFNSPQSSRPFACRRSQKAERKGNRHF